MEQETQNLHTNISLTLSENEIAALCRRWRIRELALFGSVLREDFGPASDLDILVTFAGDARWGLLDHVQMQGEFERVLLRDVDLITRRAVEQSQNWLRKQETLDNNQILYSELEA